MSLSIHTNFASLVTQNTLNKNNSLLSTAMQRLGTGFSINSAADDAAGLQIATRLSAQSRGMSVAQRNAQDAISLLQTAEGAFSEMTDIVQRMKDLATQAANGTNSHDDRVALQAEYDELGKELANILGNTTYAGEQLFDVTKARTDGKFNAKENFQIRATSDETMELDVSAKVDSLLGTASSYTDDGTAPTLNDGLLGISITFADKTKTGTEIADGLDAGGAVKTASNPNGLIDKIDD